MTWTHAPPAEATATDGVHPWQLLLLSPRLRWRSWRCPEGPSRGCTCWRFPVDRWSSVLLNSVGLIGLAGVVAVLWWRFREALRRSAEQGREPDPLDGLGYLLILVVAVLGLVAIAVGRGIGWLRRRHHAAVADGPPQVLIG